MIISFWKKAEGNGKKSTHNHRNTNLRGHTNIFLSLMVPNWYFAEIERPLGPNILELDIKTDGKYDGRLLVFSLGAALPFSPFRIARYDANDSWPKKKKRSGAECVILRRTDFFFCLSNHTPVELSLLLPIVFISSKKNESACFF